MSDYPYKNFGWRKQGDPQLFFNFESTESDKCVHMVVGHTLVNNLWIAPVVESLAFSMDWICWIDAPATFITEEIIKIFASNPQRPMCISAFMWQYSIGKLSVQEMKQCVHKIMDQLQENSQSPHRIAFPSIPYVPELEKHWDDIFEMNKFLQEINISNHLYPYDITKVLMKKDKDKNRQVKQVAWKEFTRSVSQGKTLDSKYWIQFAQFIKRFHQTSFKMYTTDVEKARLRQKEITKPDQRMKHPKDIDLRRRLNDIKSVKREEYGEGKFAKEESDDEVSEYVHGFVVRAKENRMKQLEYIQDKLEIMESHASQRKQLLSNKRETMRKTAMELEEEEQKLNKRLKEFEKVQSEFEEKKKRFERAQEIEEERQLAIKQLTESINKKKKKKF